MASFEELYPSMAKRMTGGVPPQELRVVEELPKPEEKVVELGGRPSIEDLAAQWMSVKEAAAALDCVEMTIYRMIKRNELRSTRLGPRKIRVFKPDVYALLTLEDK